MLSVEIHYHTFRLNFLERMCSQEDGNGESWKEDARCSFPSLEGVHTDEVEAPHPDLEPNAPFSESAEMRFATSD